MNNASSIVTSGQLSPVDINLKLFFIPITVEQHCKIKNKLMNMMRESYYPTRSVSLIFLYIMTEGGACP